jgi:hypothetical protein
MLFRAVPLLVLLLASLITSGQKKKLSEIESLTTNWADANSKHDIETLKSLYAGSLTFYGKTKSVNRCLSDKEGFFKINPDYRIAVSDMDIDLYKSGLIKCNFIKNEYWGGEDKNPQQAYLIFEKLNGRYLIIGESDQRMDSQLGYTPQLGDKKAANTGLFLIIGVAGGILLAGLLFYLFVKKKNKAVELPVALVKKEVRNSSENSAFSTSMQPVADTVFAQMPQTNSEKGYEFEKWVVAKFPKAYYEIKEWRSDKYHEGRYATSSMLPDLEIAYRHKNRFALFAVECKWRSDFQNGKIEWASTDQLARYKEFESTSSKPVFVVIGVGGTPDAPQSLYAIPIRVINSTVLTQYQLKNYTKYKAGDFFFDSYNNILS